MKNIIQVVLLSIVISSCGAKEWTTDRQIDLGDNAPIGIAADDVGYWISDGSNNELIQFDLSDTEVLKVEEFDRPMHIAYTGGKVYIPEYGSDQITIVQDGSKSLFELKDSLDAPAGFAISGEDIAIADFYNHRVLLKTGGEWKSIGEEGNGPKDFYYPTDVQFYGDRLFVADAYNNRIKVLDLSGRTLNSFGQEEEINAAIGLYVSDDQVFVMDQENDRVLVYNHEGVLLQTIEEGFDKPIDAAMIGNEIYVINFGGKNIQVLK